MNRGVQETAFLSNLVLRGGIGDPIRTLGNVSMHNKKGLGLAAQVLAFHGSGGRI